MQAHYPISKTSDLADKQYLDQANTRFWNVAGQWANDMSTDQRRLDLGCATGRYTFELAAHCELAIGLDLNFSLVSHAAKIQRKQKVAYQQRQRGQCFSDIESAYPAARNALFIIADALNPPFLAHTFDLVAGLNVLDNVTVPLILIGQMDALLASGGHLILSSPYEWREDISERGEWLETEIMPAAEMLRKILFAKLFPAMQLNYHSVEEHGQVPWVLCQHERHWNLFLTDMIKAQKG